MGLFLYAELFNFAQLLMTDHQYICIRKIKVNYAEQQAFHHQHMIITCNNAGDTFMLGTSRLIAYTRNRFTIRKEDCAEIIFPPPVVGDPNVIYGSAIVPTFYCFVME